MEPDIIKADGTVERFSREKLEQSLRNAGASARAATRIRETIEASMGPTAGSADIFKRAFRMLRLEGRPIAARYSLRAALFEFGPSGHPFEDFVAELFRHEGWTVEGRRMIPGKCVPHEVDVYARRGAERLAAELKYHNDASYKTDVKVALYVKARIDDIRTGPEGAIDYGMLITNTKFTRQAVDYADCAGLGLLGWSHPRTGNLYDRIVASGIYPVTALTSLKRAEKRLLVADGTVTTERLLRDRASLRAAGLSPDRIGAVVAEATALARGT